MAAPVYTLLLLSLCSIYLCSGERYNPHKVVLEKVKRNNENLQKVTQQSSERLDQLEARVNILTEDLNNVRVDQRLMRRDIIESLEAINEKLRNIKPSGQIERLLATYMKDFRPVQNDTKVPKVHRDCQAALTDGWTQSGLYTISPDGATPMEVFCDQTSSGGGWTIIQKRQNGKVDFASSWEEYKHGFGELSGDFWLGNENLHCLTSSNKQRLRVELHHHGHGFAYAEYASFMIGSEKEKYRLHIGSYSGTDTPGDSLMYHNGQLFSTPDVDNDVDCGHCAALYGAGWWFKNCSKANLNGIYGSTSEKGITWSSWMGSTTSLTSVKMMLKPKDMEIEVSTSASSSPTPAGKTTITQSQPITKPKPTTKSQTTTKSRPTSDPTTNLRPTTNPTTKPRPTTHPTTKPRPTTHPTTKPRPTTHPTTKPRPTTHPTTKPRPTTNPRTRPQPTSHLTTKPTLSTEPSTAKPQSTTKHTSKPQTTKKIITLPPTTLRPKTTTSPRTTLPPLPKNCQDVYRRGGTKSGVYTVYMNGVDKVQVHCEQTLQGGGWTVFQRRMDGSVDFNVKWADYKAGFGDPSGEYWVGNDNLHTLTANHNTQLLVELQFKNDIAYAHYTEFWIEVNNKYQLHIGGFSNGKNNPGDSLTHHNGRYFSTRDRDSTDWTCPERFPGGWWFSGCGLSNLNGVYNEQSPKGIIWHSWTGFDSSLSAVRMMIKIK